MFGLVLNALRARRAQTVALFALTVLAGLGASAAPWYLGWARDAVTDANIGSAPAAQRVVTASGAVRFAPTTPPTQELRDRVAAQLAIPGARAVVGARLYATMTQAGAGSDAPAAGLYLNYRDGVCDQLRIEGSCPTGRGDVVVSRSTADVLALAVGDQVRLEGFRLPAPVTLRISGIYQVVDLLGVYWAGTDLLSGPPGVIGTLVEDPAFVSEQTLFAANPDGLDMDLHVTLPASAFHSSSFDLAGTLERARVQLRQANLNLSTEATTLIDQIARDQRLVGLGIGVAATQLVLLCWFGLFLAVRHTSQERRVDIGLLKLRGAPPWRIWALTAQQSAWPMLTGALLGWILGWIAAGALAGSVLAPMRTQETSPLRSLGLSLLAAAIACVGALVAAVLAEWGLLGAPVVTLLRSVPGRHRGWRADVVDLVVVLLAVAGVYQGHAEVRTGGGPSLFALVAPALVGLAVALLVARALPYLAGQAGAAALRGGRPGGALAALHLARRPDTSRIFAVVAVAVSVFTTVALFWHTATAAWSERAVQELGAARVLTVRASSSAHLLHAVRAADPQGRYAMAVAGTEGVRPENRLLAVDTARLAQVALLPSAYRLDPAGRLATLLHPAAPAPTRVADGQITLDATGPTIVTEQAPVDVRLHLSTVDGAARMVDFGPLTASRQRYLANVSGCAGGCELVAVELVAERLIAEGRAATVEIDGLAQSGVDVLPAAMLGDVTRWRPQLGQVGIGTVIAAHDGWLALSLFTGARPAGQRIDARVFPVTAPAPLPVVLAGPRPVPQRSGDERVTVLGAARVPYQVVASAGVLPRLGGSGLLADLDYAERSDDSRVESAALEVWLTADAPGSVIAALTGQGVQVLAEETLASRTRRLAEQGPGIALRFQLFAAGVVLLLAAGTVIVAATVERRTRAEELGAARAQGMSSRAVTIAAYAPTAALVGAALLTGVLAALLAQVAVTASLPVFADGWSLLPPSVGFAWSLLAAGFAAFAVLGAAALAGSARVIGDVQARERGASS